MEADELKRRIRDLFAGQRLAVLATHNRGNPYANLMAFAATDDLRQLLFATTRATRKYANLASVGCAAMLVDNRSNREADFHEAAAVTATGRVVEFATEEAETFFRIYLAKHPYMEEFVKAPTSALFRLVVETYYVVLRFQNVFELHMRS
jgi:hypothetical protein